MALWDAIREAESWEFSRGEHDCCGFVSHVVKHLTGRDLMAEFPKYRTKAEAERIIASCGGWEGMLDKVLPRIPVRQAGRGDVVLMGDEIGICVGTAVASMTQQGIRYRPIEEATAAWAK